MNYTYCLSGVRTDLRAVVFGFVVWAELKFWTTKSVWIKLCCRTLTESWTLLDQSGFSGRSFSPRYDADESLESFCHTYLQLLRCNFQSIPSIKPRLHLRLCLSDLTFAKTINTSPSCVSRQAWLHLWSGVVDCWETSSLCPGSKTLPPEDLNHKEEGNRKCWKEYETERV